MVTPNLKFSECGYGGRRDRVNSNKNEVFEYLIDQLRQQVNNNQCEDLAHEVQSLKNQLRDTSALVAELQKGRRKYLDGSFEPAKDCVHEWVRNPRRNAHVCHKCGDVAAYVIPEQSGCRKEDTQYNAWRPHYGARQPVPDGTMVFTRYRNGEQPKHSVAVEKRSWIWDGTYADIVEYKIDPQGCDHEWRFYGKGFSCKCIKCGAVS